MAHKYYCTHCARELNQDLILLDMGAALTVSSENRFSGLKFRVTLKEFNELLSSGKQGDLDYTHLDLPFQKFAAFLGNENNLNDPEIAALTLEEVKDYLKHRQANDFNTPEQQQEEDAYTLVSQAGGFDPNDLFGSTAAPKQKTVEEYVPTPAIKALLYKMGVSKGDELTERMLEDDLDQARKAFGDEGVARIILKPRYEKADTGDDILIGYHARRGDRQIPVDARVCCHCDTPVFEHAGVAVHRSVAFIGEQASGKTSTILALTHYAQRAARRVDPNDPIWSTSASLDGIEFIQVVGKGANLQKDLDLYAIGVAPEKTNAQQRTDAYCSTLWITNKGGKKFILTLIDLPGELCKKDGTIDGERIMTEFPVALACDAFIMCFDTSNVKGGESNEINTRTCGWASQFQSLRQDYKTSATINDPSDRSEPITRDCVAPMMVIFTKCEELEGDTPEAAAEHTYFNPRRVDEVYSLKIEREFIDRNDNYKDVGDLIRVYENLKDAYIARLRTSPYGFAAPNESKYLENDSVNKNADGTIKYSRPKQVMELMRWLMHITGCIPCPAEFCPNPMEPEHVYRLHDTYVTRPQYRVQVPGGGSPSQNQRTGAAGQKAQLDEAMCRAFLFENYSPMDQDRIESWGTEPEPEPFRIFDWLKNLFNGGKR